jgi:hypothetical protein
LRRYSKCRWKDAAKVRSKGSEQERDRKRDREREIIEGKKICEQSKQYKEVYTWVT